MSSANADNTDGRWFRSNTIGPIARFRNEGFGDEPGPIDVSNYWQQVSYVLIPLGISIIILTGLALVLIDRQRWQK